MLVNENIELINGIVDKIFEFIREDKDVTSDLANYIESIKHEIKSEAESHSAIMSYLFERKLQSCDKSVFELYEEKNQDLADAQKEVLSSLEKSISSVFELKKISRTGFELYNLVNEKTYPVLSLTKISNLRGIFPGYYFIARIFSHNGDNYIISLDKVLPSSARESALRYVVMKQLENPELLYHDNEAKLVEMEESVKDLGNKFSEYFAKEEIITTSDHIDDLLRGFNDFVEGTGEKQQEEIDRHIVLPESYAYFEVKEVTGEVIDPIQAAVKGFSSHEKVYDVGIIFDKDNGLMVLPFYGTFKEIFNSEDYKSVKGYKDCIRKYIESEKVATAPIIRIYNINPEKFNKIIGETLELDKPDLTELFLQYKKKYLKNKVFSALTVLYLSRAFSELMEIAGADSEGDFAEHKIGRNDPCPCGSGKKYKKCCLG